MQAGKKITTDFFAPVAAEEVKGIFIYENTRLRFVLDYLKAGEMLREW